MATKWGTTPRKSVERECTLRGERAVVHECKKILSCKEFDTTILYSLAGPGADQILVGREGGVDGYWPRVWALRALLYAWDDSAIEAVLGAQNDESWRVREMCAKVVALRRLDEGLDAMVSLKSDDVLRVRQAAARARARITGFDN